MDFTSVYSLTGAQSPKWAQKFAGAQEFARQNEWTLQFFSEFCIASFSLEATLALLSLWSTPVPQPWPLLLPRGGRESRYTLRGEGEQIFVLLSVTLQPAVRFDMKNFHMAFWLQLSLQVASRNKWLRENLPSSFIFKILFKFSFLSI